MQLEATQAFVMCGEAEKPVYRTHSLAPNFDTNTELFQSICRTAGQSSHLSKHFCKFSAIYINGEFPAYFSVEVTNSLTDFWSTVHTLETT